MDSINAIPCGISAPANKTEDPAVSAQRLDKLRSTSVDFEAVLLQQMFQKMQDSLQGGSLVGDGLSGSVYSGIMTQAVAKSMAEKQSIGVSKEIYHDVIKHDSLLKKYTEANGITWDNMKGLPSSKMAEKAAPGMQPTPAMLPSQNEGNSTQFRAAIPLQKSPQMPIKLTGN